MSERILRFFLDELKTVRLVCQNETCKGVVEMKIGPMMTVPHICPVCNSELYDSKTAGQVNLLESLLRTFPRVADLKGRVKVEFVLPDNG